MAPTATPALSPIGRQKGKTVTGTLKRGAPAATLRENTGAKSTSSIPTKYETVLSTTPVEQDAFGTRTQRFSHAENDLPGPGKYYKPRKAMFEYDNSQSSQVHPSISKRGFGGFASRSNRLPRPAVGSGPGPMAYNHMAIIQSKAPRQEHNKAMTSSSFAQPLDNVGPPLMPLYVTDAGPGPGSYVGVSNAVSVAPASAAVSVFASTSDRLVTSKDARSASKLPGPGQYASSRGVGDTTRRGNMAPALKANAGGHKTVSLAAPSVIYGDVMPHITPGPGSYEVGSSFEGDVAFRSSVGTLLSPRSASSMFAETSTDRFGRPAPSTPNSAAASASRVYMPPGPGQYEVLVHTSAHMRRGGAGSVFKSASSRGADGGFGGAFRPPGPAFYSPNFAATSKKSFHLNGKKRWL